MSTNGSRGGPTIVDVARAARVSRQTVSNALNAPDRVHPDTLARVLAVIEALGYVPNRMARSLRTRSTRQIGYRLDPQGTDIAGSLQHRFLDALTCAAESENYLLLLFGSRPADGEPEHLEYYADLLRTGTVDGFVLSGARPGDPLPGWLDQRRAPFVCFGRPGPARADQLWVDVDGAAGTEAAVDHLVAAGHRAIGYIGWPSTSGPGAHRLEGWQRAMRKHGLDTGACVSACDTFGDSTAGVLSLLTRCPTPTAIVAASDTFALGAYAAARERGLEIGRDLAVVGFGDSPTASLVTPALTSVRQPLEQAGHAVIRLLVARLQGRPCEDAPGVLLSPSLVVRDSA